MAILSTRTREGYRHALSDHLPAGVMRLLDRHFSLDPPQQFLLLDTSSPLNLKQVGGERIEDLAPRDFIANIKRINDIRRVNKFMEAVNDELAPKGYFLGCVETSQMRYQRLERKFIKPLNYIYLILDYLVKRVWPKMPFFKRSYFFLTNGRNRVISETETYGRLVSCGFRLEGTTRSNGLLYFLARKVKAPEYNLEATYGPLIRLRRFGKDGKMIRVYKFRTMYPYSEYIQDMIYEQNGLQEGGKLNQDPRVNRMGAFMRKFWLDELPMLWNLLRGDLKLIGVRPLSAHYLSLYPEAFQVYRRRFKPGLIPPFYVDLPVTHEEIVASEERYLRAYERNPIGTDLRYLWLAGKNILFRGARSN